MSMMYANGIITSELCPFCDNPEPVSVRHGRNDNGSFVHDYDCDVCGGDMSIVGYPCPECALEPANPGSQADGAKCPECDSKILPSQYCMMGHWCGERPAAKA